MKFIIFSLYPLGSGSGSGSIWTFFGSRIRIRIIIDADPQHWLKFVQEDLFLFKLLIFINDSASIKIYRCNILTFLKKPKIQFFWLASFQFYVRCRIRIRVSKICMQYPNYQTSPHCLYKYRYCQNTITGALVTNKLWHTTEHAIELN